MIDTIKILLLVVLFISVLLPVIIKFGGLFIGFFNYIPAFCKIYIVIAFIIILLKIVKKWISD